jgi:hypothetical protein
MKKKKRAKITISVAQHQDELYFLIEALECKIYFKILSSFPFNGFTQPVDTYEIIRDGRVLDKGDVRYYGTHGATNLFFPSSLGGGFKGDNYSPEEFKEGDRIEIHTSSFLSNEKFMIRFICQSCDEKRFRDPAVELLRGASGKSKIAAEEILRGEVITVKNRY